MAPKKKKTPKAKPKKRTSAKKAKTTRKKPRTTAKKKSSVKRSPAGETMAKRKRSSKKTATTKRRSSSAKPKAKLKDVVLNVLTMLGGGVAASVAANKLPVASNKTRALIPLGIGAIAVMLGAKKKKSTAVSLGTGMMLVGGLSAIRANFPSVPLLAGEDSDVLELMGEMDLVEGENDYYVPQLEYAGEGDDLDGEEYYIEGEGDDLDGEVYEVAGEGDDLDGEFDDLEGDVYEISGAEYPTPANM